MAYSWECPHCNRPVTIGNNDERQNWHSPYLQHQEPRIGLHSHFIVCPNPKCHELTLIVSLHNAIRSGSDYDVGDELREWHLIPQGSAKPFPNYIPQAILEDYGEACLIETLSPKASATLSRRCLQGMIRDFWGIQGRTLYDEVQALEEKVDGVTWSAIDAVRKIGNIGAHMERDIDVIVDVEPREARLLIELIETLLKEWYVTREDRKLRMAAIVATAAAKDEAKLGGQPDPSGALTN